MTLEETLNELLVKLFKDILEIEAKSLITEEFKDITYNDMHIIEAVGVDEPRNMKTVAKLMSVTTGTLTKAMDALCDKGYVIRERSTKDKRVIKLRLTDRGLPFSSENGKRTAPQSSPIFLAFIDLTYSYSTFFVATTSTPVPATSFMITSPICTGAATSTVFNAFTQSKIFPFGISSFVFTDTISILPPDTRTVEVTILVGFVTSFRP